jgi:hypothetical protein
MDPVGGGGKWVGSPVPGAVTTRAVCACLQIVAMFVSLNFAWPVELQQLYAAMSVFNFNIQITAPEVSGEPQLSTRPFPHRPRRVKWLRARVQTSLSVRW